MYAASEMFRRLKLLFYEGLVDDEFRRFIRNPAPLPDFNLTTHPVEIALHTVHTDRNCVDQTEVLRVLRESKNNLERLRKTEGLRYEERPILVIDKKRKKHKAATFVVREEYRREGLATSAAYVSWIVYGLRDHAVPEEWIAHVIDVAIDTNERADIQAGEQTRIIKTL